MCTPLANFSPKASVQQQRDDSFSERRAASSDAACRIRRILLQAMQKSRRNGTWYRIGRLERVLFGLALRLKVKFRSPLLLRILVGVLKRLREMGDRAYLAMQQGSRLAWLYSDSAVRWGHSAARAWRNDRSYILFLGLCSQTGDVG
jgi:hypothetical protein